MPTLSSFSEEGKPLRLLQHSVAKDDADPKALSCYGLYVPELDHDQTWLRFVDGRPVVSGITTRFLQWSCEKRKARSRWGRRVLVLIWDNAPWHIRSREVRRWLGKHNLARLKAAAKE